MIKNRLLTFLLLIILILAGFTRIYKITESPPSLSWDEAAVGVNGWTIANYGQDEYGKNFPLTFRSFGDDKHPIHIYATAIFVKFLGLNEFSTRLPSATFGFLNVLVIFFLGWQLFKSKWVGLLAAFMLAVSPYAIHFSRFSHELNFAVFFFMLGLLLFLLGLEKKAILIPLAFISFGLSLLSYHSAEVVLPPLILLLIILSWKKLFTIKKYFIAGLIILSLFVLLMFKNPTLLGIARVNQTSFDNATLMKTSWYQTTHNLLAGRAQITLEQYFKHFSPEYLFISGDSNPRLSATGFGLFYKIDTIFLVIGLIGLLAALFRKDLKQTSLIVLAWALLAPLPAALVKEAPHAARAMFMVGSWHLIAAYGLYLAINSVKDKYFKLTLLIIVIIVYLIGVKQFMSYYLDDYSKRYAIEWQYGMKQIVDYIKLHPEYSLVYMTDIRSQPYVFFLYYLKTPLPEYLRTVIYNNNIKNKSYNSVSTFDKYAFGGWDEVDSKPNPGVLYIIGSSHFDGLRYKAKFIVVDTIRYPNNTVAFYMISAK